MIIFGVAACICSRVGRGGGRLSRDVLGLSCGGALRQGFYRARRDLLSTHTFWLFRIEMGSFEVLLVFLLLIAKLCL